MSVIETKRLILRHWNPSDIEPFIQMNQSKDVMKYFPDTLSREEVTSLHQRIIKHFKTWGYGLYATELKETNRFIGFIGLSHPRFESHFTPCVEIGWRLVKEIWGRGLATEGAEAVLQHAFEQLDLHEIYSFTAIDNIPSYKVMKKIGMTKVGTFNHPNLPSDSPLSKHWIYHISRPLSKVLI